MYSRDQLHQSCKFGSMYSSHLLLISVSLLGILWWLSHPHLGLHTTAEVLGNWRCLKLVTPQQYSKNLAFSMEVFVRRLCFLFLRQLPPFFMDWFSISAMLSFYCFHFFRPYSYQLLSTYSCYVHRHLLYCHSTVDSFCLRSFTCSLDSFKMLFDFKLLNTQSFFIFMT